MCSLRPSLVFTLLFLNISWVVNAGLFVVDPLRGSVCRANTPCTVTWLDDGRVPLLSSIGVSTVGLYEGSDQLVQTISPVNVAVERSLTFTPIPEAGPNSDNYYISFTSTTLKVNDSSYRAYSSFFRLTGMSGSFDSSLPAAVSTKPIPSSLTQSRSSSSTSTITVGTLYTSLQPVTTPATSISSPTPRFTTSIVSSSSSPSTASSALAPSSSSLPPSSSSPSSSSSIPSPSSTAQSRAVGLTTSSAILLPSSLLISTLLSWFLRMLYS